MCVCACVLVFVLLLMGLVAWNKMYCIVLYWSNWLFNDGRSSSTSASTEQWRNCPPPSASAPRIWPALQSCSSSSSWPSPSSATCFSAVRLRNTAAFRSQCTYQYNRHLYLIIFISLYLLNIAIEQKPLYYTNAIYLFLCSKHFVQYQATDILVITNLGSCLICAMQLPISTLIFYFLYLVSISRVEVQSQRIMSAWCLRLTMICCRSLKADV